ncbi:Holliday junction resolvase MOC1, chloroplastic-like isoform X1 [Glycine soja]|uniref:Holliday junction resolvase MOC1, chloroplastic-like isoform X1 n=1 Tax=Glycine soja TaxID=3848 RepID=UPI0010408D02|nr:Holliday junction resolvase MOC1, chloroplastic-like isoform X1 [Glycine soja]
MSFFMESLQFTPQSYQLQFHFMNKLSPKFKPTISSIHFRTFCDSSSSPSTTLTQTQNPSDPQIIVPNRKRRVKASSDTQFKENWLASLSYPFPEKTHLLSGEHEPTHQNDGSKWVLGIDPDVSGAVALLKTHGSVCSAQHMQVFDSPHVKILVGKNKRTRRRLDAKSVVELVCGFDAPIGTTAFIEQSLPYPQDGKQGWWSGGFGYGLWIGILVASGFSVIPVPSFTWKAKFELSGNGTTKDDSRRIASTLFPSMTSMLSRKKDHGRAEALLIAAYGQDQNKTLKPSCCDTILDNLEN